MSTYLSRPVVSDGWETVSRSLTSFVNKAGLVAYTDVIVYCFDHTVPTWETDPAAWYSPKTREICLNMTKILRTADTQKHLQECEETISTKMLDSEKNSYYTLSSEGLERLSAHVLSNLGSKRMSYTYSDKKKTVLESHYYANETIQSYLKTEHSKSTPTYTVTSSIAMTVLGVIMHETGHSVSSNFILEKWWAKLSQHDRQVLTLMEELRTEAKQVERLGGHSLPCLAKAYPVVLDLDQQIKDLEKYSDDDGVTSESYASAIALNSTLVLGRTVYGGYSGMEVSNLALAVEMAVGIARYDAMFEIWRDYCKIETVSESNARAIAKRWSDLYPPTDFKSSVAPSVVIKDDHEVVEESGTEDESLTHTIVDETDSSGDGPGTEYESSETSESSDEDSEVDYEEDSEEHGAGAAIIDSAHSDSIESTDVRTDDEAEDRGKEDLSKSVVDAIVVVKRELARPKVAPIPLTVGASAFGKISSHARFRKVTPSKEDLETAQKMTHALQRIYVSGKDRFHVNNDLPPGRLKSRAAVQNAAYRKQGLQTRKQQWERTRVTVDLNPSLTVGIMTDVSGSQSWAESLSSRLSWILSKAFRTVNARTATVAFGERIYMPSVPGEPMREQILITADQSTEKFDVGLGALDHILKLTNSLGVRMLFVLTDGIFVETDENKKANQWVKNLSDSGCKTVWIYPDGSYYRVPPDAIPLAVDAGKVASKPGVLIDAIIKTIEDELSKEKSV